jgi:hypothetical protein
MAVVRMPKTSTPHLETGNAGPSSRWSGFREDEWTDFERDAGI